MNSNDGVAAALSRTLTRRNALGLAGLVGAVGAVGSITTLRGVGASPAEAATVGTCTVTPVVTEGPYWVDEKLNRSDVRSDGDGSNTQAGIPLTLSVLLKDSACGEPVQNAQIDIWHANAPGHYSDYSQEGTAGHQWLRGYQVTDSQGRVTFTTVYPGWYSGRAIHIHVRIRMYDASGNATINYTTQFFFDETYNNAVVATPTYTHSGQRVLNANDGIYQSEVQQGGAVLVPLSGNTSAGYVGTVAIALRGTAPTGSTTPGGSTGTTTYPAPVLTQTNSNGTVTLKLHTAAAFSGKTVYFYRRSGQTGQVVPLGTAKVGSTGVATRTFNAKRGQILALYANVPAATGIKSTYSNTIAFKVS